MGLPKNYKKSLKITPTLIGVEARQHILNDIANPGTYLPKGLLHEDMDRDFIDYVDNELDLVLGEEKVPVIFLSIQRWAEFAKTWQFSDQNKNIKIPFLTIVRKPDAQVGTNYAGSYNIPGKPTFTYMKIPTWDGNRKGYDIYKIPQPVSIDLQYEVRLFCNKMRDLNSFNKKILESFAAGQKYLRINGHPIPLMLESIGDESVISNLDERKYYVQLFTIKMMGYLLDEDDFEVAPAISRGIAFFEISDDLFVAPFQVTSDDEEKTICITITFERGVNSVNIPIEINANYNNINTVNISSSSFEVNGSPVTIPFKVVNGDTLYVSINKTDVLKNAVVEINGLIE